MGNNPSHHAALFGGVPSRERQAWVRPKPPGSKRKQSQHPQQRGQYNPGPAPPELDRYPPPPGNMQGYNEEPAPYGYPPPPPGPGNHGPPIHHGAGYPPQTPRGNHQHEPSYDDSASEDEEYMPAPSASDRFIDRDRGRASEVGSPISHSQVPKHQKQPSRSQRPHLTHSRSSASHPRPPGVSSRQEGPTPQHRPLGAPQHSRNQSSAAAPPHPRYQASAGASPHLHDQVSVPHSHPRNLASAATPPHLRNQAPPAPHPPSRNPSSAHAPIAGPERRRGEGGSRRGESWRQRRE